jgi:rhodanese-related sulfurtransferase
MKNFVNLFIVIPLLVISLAGCSGGKSEKKVISEPETVAKKIQAPAPGYETDLLLKDLVANGDYVNSQQYPSLIKASLVYQGIGGKNLVIDLRSPAKFASGHIKGAVNKQFESLPAYFETGIKPFEFEKIILVCDDGQISSYTTSLLRLKGYGNVYAMRWGMSSWNRQLAQEGWLSGLSGKYESKIDTASVAKPVPVGMPEIKTGLTSGKDISDARFSKLFEEGTAGILISADEVFSNPSGYFIINLERKDKYQDGHIPGAVRYKPEETLGFTDEMSTIPFDKPVVLYCGTGHNSAFATAFLRLFGYDARTLKYGNNSFMHDRMISRKASLSWLPFGDTDINDFPVVK